jgi:Bacterial Ig-like domain (group 3)/Bacterial Ig-like domain (group 1)
VYLLDPTQFSDVLNAAANPAQFLVNSLPVDQDLTSLFAQTAVLASTSQTVNGPVNPVVGVPLQTGLVTVRPGQSITVMFDVTTIIPEGNTVDFFSTLGPASVFFTDQGGNPVTNLLAVGPAFATPATAATLALSPTSASNAAGTKQTLTAAATDSNNAPVVGAIVHFTISGGPNAGPSVPAVTDANGMATLTYTDAAGAGTDTVQAAIGTLESNAVQVSWTNPGPLDHITINPSASIIAPGGTQSYTTQGADVFGHSTGDVTAATVFSISPDGSCNAANCTATSTGPHIVTGTDNGKTAQATLQVGGKLDDTTSVTSNHNASVAGQSVTFTAIVTTSAGTPTGTVTFKDGSATLASGVALSGGVATFSTSSLSIGTHTITAVYSGDSNLNGTGAGSSTAIALTQQVQYGVCLLYDPTRAAHSGATYPLKLTLCDASGNDLSSSSIIVHATSVFMSSTNSGTPEATGNANPDSDFRFDSTLGTSGGYIFNLSTNGLTGGTYGFTFTAGNDPTVHTVQPGFGVK